MGKQFWPSRGLWPVIVAAVLLVGCSSRSISDSDYPDAYGRSNSLYNGELSEFDVIGVDPDAVTDADIAAALKASTAVELPPGSRVLVVQSGAAIPDEAMLEPLRARYRIGIFSGVPDASDLAKQAEPKAREHYSKGLRMAAARGGYSSILCYWGVLEATQRDLVTKSVSWVPIAGAFVPDETQEMRIRLKLAVVDVRTGNWTTLAPTPIVDKALTAGLVRRSSDQDQVATLKAKGYRAAVDELSRKFQ